MEYMMEAELGI